MVGSLRTPVGLKPQMRPSVRKGNRLALDGNQADAIAFSGVSSRRGKDRLVYHCSPMKSVLFTCGIGDFIAMESYFTPAERAEVESIHWASRARASLMDLIPFVFPNVKTHKIERDTWGAPFTRTFCISSRKELPGLDPSVHDWSVKIIVDDFKRGRRRFQGSTLVGRKLADISALNLPARYFVLHPYSENARTPVRDLSAEELSFACKRIQRIMSIVVINKGGNCNPIPGTIDLSDQLTLPESIEVVKQSSGFVGAASVFSVVASKVLPPQKLFIKGSLDLKMNYSNFYYAPHRTHDFVAQNLMRILQRV